jgi:uncharacterized protein YjbJ (UPF0337 family)
MKNRRDQARELPVKQHRTAAASRGRDLQMSPKSEAIKGRIKEAAATLTDDDKLRREGKLSRATGKVELAVEKALEETKSRSQ